MGMDSEGREQEFDKAFADMLQEKFHKFRGLIKRQL